MISINPVQVNAGSIAPITAVQFGAHRVFDGLLLGNATHELSSPSRVGIAMAAGLASAFVSTPAELVMIQQQKHGRSLTAELQHILAKHGSRHLYRRLVNTSISPLLSWLASF